MTIGYDGFYKAKAQTSKSLLLSPYLELIYYLWEITLCTQPTIEVILSLFNFSFEIQPEFRD